MCCLLKVATATRCCVFLLSAQKTNVSTNSRYQLKRRMAVASLQPGSKTAIGRVLQYTPIEHSIG